LSESNVSFDLAIKSFHDEMKYTIQQFIIFNILNEHQIDEMIKLDAMDQIK